MLIRYSVVYDTLVTYYRSQGGKIIRERLYPYPMKSQTQFSNFQRIRDFCKVYGWDIIHDDGEE